MTDHRQAKLDRRKLVAAAAALGRGRARLKEGPAGDPFWGPILGDLGVALDVLKRRLDEAGEPGEVRP